PPLSSILTRPSLLHLFFFNDTPTTELSTLSLHDALPICAPAMPPCAGSVPPVFGKLARTPSLIAPRPSSLAANACRTDFGAARRDRKSTRLNSSHDQISYAVFCLKKKKNKKNLRVAL